MKQRYIRPEVIALIMTQNLMVSFSTSSNTEISPGEARSPRNCSSTEDVDSNWE